MATFSSTSVATASSPRFRRCAGSGTRCSTSGSSRCGGFGRRLFLMFYKTYTEKVNTENEYHEITTT
jgi:hypothetical protein